MSVLPSVWTMEMDLYHERCKERDLQMTQVASSNSSLVNTDEDKVSCEIIISTMLSKRNCSY